MRECYTEMDDTKRDGLMWQKTAKTLHGVQEVGGSNPLTQIFLYE